MSEASRTRLLVLGSSGFLGPHLVRAGAERFDSVVAACRHPEAHPTALPGRARPRVWDGGRAIENVSLFAETRPTAVIVAAALSRMSDCERDPDAAHRINAALPGALARLAGSFGARLVHVSTDLVFGGEPAVGERYTPADPPRPLSVYGQSKADGEERVLQADPKALVCRLPLLYGESFGRGLGASDGLTAALERGETPTLFADEWRTPLEVSDAAAALVELAASTARGVIHVSGPERVSRVELGRAVLRHRGLAEEELARSFREGGRAELGLERVRPADVSLEDPRVRELLTVPLRGVGEVLSAP